MSKPVVVISGATGYFGRYLVQHLRAQFHVVATSRRKEELERLFPEADVTKVPLDIYNEKELIDGLEKIGSQYSPFGLINNAYDFSPKTGFNTQEGRLEKIDIGMIRNALDSGLIAPMLFCQTLGRHMIRAGKGGSIINISSMYGTVAPDKRLYDGKDVFNPVTYGVTKAGLDGLTRYVASFWGDSGIRCNSVAPGSFPNTESQSVNAPNDLEFLERLKRKTVLGRVGHPRDLLGIVSLLLSDQGSYITGQTIGVDGGWTAT